MKNAWAMVPLDQVLTERREAPPPDAVAATDIRIVGSIGFKDGQIRLRPDGATKTKMILIEPGDLVMSGINAAKGAIAVYEEDQTQPIAATIHYSSYIVNKQRADTRFLWWLLRSDTFRNLMNRNLNNGIKTELKAKRLLPIRVLLPPTTEQRQIVARIEALASRFEKARQLHRGATVELSRVLGAEIDGMFNRADCEFGRLQDFLVGRPRNGWSPPAPYKAGDGVPVLTLSAVTRFQYDGSKVKWTKAPTIEDAHYWIKPGELLVTRSNTPELVGHAAIYDGNPPRCICPDLIMKMTIDHKKADVEFVHYWLQSATVRRFIMSHARGTSSTMKKLNQNHVQQIPVPKMPLAEQRAIAKHLNELCAKGKRLEVLQSDIDAELASFMPALLAKAFRGEL